MPRKPAHSLTAGLPGQRSSGLGEATPGVPGQSPPSRGTELASLRRLLRVSHVVPGVILGG
jgi:hypothetical protein